MNALETNLFEGETSFTDPKMDPEKTSRSKRLHIRGKRCQMAQTLCKLEENENRRLLGNSLIAEISSF